jgi:hypothetical protein
LWVIESGFTPAPTSGQYAESPKRIRLVLAHASSAHSFAAPNQKGRRGAASFYFGQQSWWQQSDGQQSLVQQPDAAVKVTTVPTNSVNTIAASRNTLFI